MKKDQYPPLTQTVYYILLALLQPAHGYLIMSRVEAMSSGQVPLAPGTLYGALENLVKQRMISRVPSTDPRRKVYQITESGLEALTRDAQRMRHMIHIFEQSQEGTQ